MRLHTTNQHTLNGIVYFSDHFSILRSTNKLSINHYLGAPEKLAFRRGQQILIFIRFEN